MSIAFLSDRKWLFGIIITIIGAFVPVAIALIQRDRKEFSCEVISKATVLDTSNPAFSKVKSYFQERELKKLAVWTVKLTNSGSVPILRETFDSPIILTMRGEVSVLTILVSESHPPGFRPKVKQMVNDIVIESTLWNPNDNVTLQILVDGQSTGLEAVARIAGIREVTTTDPTNYKERKRAYMSIILSILSAVGYGFFFFTGFFFTEFLFAKRTLWRLAIPCILFGILLEFVSIHLYILANLYLHIDLRIFTVILLSLIFVWAGKLLTIPLEMAIKRGDINIKQLSHRGSPETKH